MEKHKDRARWRKRWIPYLGILLMVVCGILGTEYVAGLATQRVLESQQRETQAQLSELRARIESEINSVLYLTRGLSAYIVARPDAAPGELEIIASHILRGSQHIRNIGLAPDNVVRFVYPRQGNEAVLGLNYEKDRRQWPAILQAIDRNDTMVAGPLELVQGELD
ncbi:CHASE domain-containing protein [Marinobacterium aestuariivivens]|uniref:CHASE domain-containing protein n=1 Tax=Marinobacterium aestuariivivens TaxID=1698799 RepID=A0ABW1ZVW7_9GAMM